MKIRWNKVDGAEGYDVFRLSYDSAEDNATISSIDKYFCDKDGKIKQNDEDPGKDRAMIFYDGSSFTLTEKYVEPDSDDGKNLYQINQSKIPWGLPYGYIIIPVLNAEDFTIVKDNGSFSLTGSTIEYSNLNEIKNSTFGYGLNIHATKAESTSVVTLSWDAPYSANTKTMKIFKREAGSSSNVWSALNVDVPLKSKSISITPEVSERDSAYEYAVCYGMEKNVIELATSFMKKLSENKEADEQANKGYLFTITQLQAQNGEEFWENVVWTPYNFDERNVGPDYYELQIKNLNISDEWNTIARLKAKSNNNYDENGYFDFDCTTTSDDVEMIFDKTSMKIKPKSISGFGSEPTKGLLKVLRDPHCYYRLVAKRSFTKNGSAIEIEHSVGDDYSVYATRQITDIELVKAATLAFSYAFYYEAGGAEDHSNISKGFEYADNKNIYSTNGGNAKFESKWLIPAWVWDEEVGKYAASFSMKNYSPKMLMPSGKIAEIMSLTVDSGEVRIKGLSNAYIDKIRTNGGVQIKSKNVDSSGPNYDAVVTIECTSSSDSKISINRDGRSYTVVTTSSDDDRRRWLPMEIADDGNYWFTSTEYGWW